MESWEADGRRQVAAAEFIDLDNIIVRTIIIPQPPHRDFTIPLGHGVGNCSLTFCRNSSQLELGGSRSHTPIFQWNRLPAFHPLWLYVSVFCLGLMVMIAMVVAMMMIARVMVLVMVITVLEALSK
jgi:hypothetical protein